jgi:integrase
MPRHRLAERSYRLQLRGAVWTIFYTDPVSSSTRRVSTGERDKARAEVWRAQWIAGLDRPAPPSQPRITDMLDGYLAARQPHVGSYRTLQVSAANIKRHVGNLEPRMLASRAYLDRRVKDGVSDGTIRRETGVLRAALAWAVREKWITDAPHAEMPPQPLSRDRWLTREEVDALIRAAATPHIRLYIVLGYHTAARTGAILDLTWDRDRVDLERRLISYDRPGRVQSRKRRATVPINTVALAELQAARVVAVSDHVIEWRGRPVQSIKTGFAAACERAGIADCSPHILRHSAATHMVMLRVPMVDIARMLGDTVAMVERVYGKHSPDFLRSAAEALAGKTGPREPLVGDKAVGE